MKKPTAPKAPSPVVSASVRSREDPREPQARLDREVAERHARFLRTLDRIDRERGGRPHRPALVNETLHADAVADWDAPVIRAIAAQVGPRTGDHPQAVRCDRPIPEPRPQATRTRPTALQDALPQGPRPALPAVALSAALILSAVAGALWLARGF